MASSSKKLKAPISDDGQSGLTNIFSVLPRDLMDLVLLYLNLLDHVRLGATCKYLHSCTMRDNPPVSKPLCLVSSTNPSRSIKSFLCHPLACGLRSHRPPKADRRRCVGHRGGWLAIDQGNQDKTIFLFNRFSGSRVNLPPRRRLPLYRRIRKVIMSSDPGSDDCVVAVLHGDAHVFICRPRRDDLWTAVGHEEEHEMIEGSFIVDIAFHNGRLWAVHSFGPICMLDIDTPKLKDPSTSELQRSPPKLGKSGLSLPLHSYFTYLVESCGKLLVVTTTFFYYFETAEEARTLRVWEVLPGAVVETSDLGGRALLLSGPSSVSVGPDDKIRSLQGERIYHRGSVYGCTPPWMQMGGFTVYNRETLLFRCSPEMPLHLHLFYD